MQIFECLPTCGARGGGVWMGVFLYRQYKGVVADWVKCSNVCLLKRIRAPRSLLLLLFMFSILVNIGTLLGKLKINASYVG